jgi:hypothetical protein
MRSALEDPSQVGLGPGSSYSVRIPIHTRTPGAGGEKRPQRHFALELEAVAACHPQHLITTKKVK